MAENEATPEKPAEPTEKPETPVENKSVEKIKLSQKIKDWWRTPKGKKQFFTGLGIAIILAIVGFVAYRQFGPQPASNTTTPKTVSGTLPNLDENKVTTVASKLDGLSYDPSVANRAPLAIIVENHPDARPQSGLDKASVVFEALAEGGITRFMAVFGPQDAAVVGPVRSARTYFVDYVEGYNAFFGHVGGNIDALDRLEKEPVKNLDEFANAAGYWRDNSKKVATEHTMFTDTTKLYDIAKSKGWSMDASFDGYTYKDDTAVTQRPTSQNVTVKFSSAQYEIKYTYDPKDNTYARVMGGVSHKDAQTGKQIMVKNIAVIEVPAKETKTRINESGLTMTTTGSGKATIFMDGKQIDGTWSKDKTTSMLTFKDSAGSAIQFDRGNLWIEVVPPGQGLGATAGP